jgi:lysine-N-methylase
VVKPGDLTLRYMERFHCIGPDCEDCCCFNWRVDIDERGYQRMKALTTLAGPEERKRWESSVVKKEIPGKDKKGWVIKFREEDNGCPHLLPNHTCDLHNKYGLAALPDVCAIYPRRLQYVGESLEMTGFVSCPEVARQLLLQKDAIEPIGFDRDSVRQVIVEGMDPRDVRPYWRLLVEVRGYILSLLTRPGLTLQARLFLMTWFAKRTSPILSKTVMKGDVELVRAEMRALEDPATCDEVVGRFAALETPAAVAFMIAHELVQARGPDTTRRTFHDLVSDVTASYEALRTLGVGEESSLTVETVWTDYKRRREKILDRAGERVEQYFVNATYNYWMHRLPLEAPDLMVHMLRLLALTAVHKFLLFSYPGLIDAIPDPAFESYLDAAVVDVFYKVGRYIEHSLLMKKLEEALEKRELRSLAGAVYLIKL